MAEEDPLMSHGASQSPRGIKVFLTNDLGTVVEVDPNGLGWQFLEPQRGVTVQVMLGTYLKIRLKEDHEVVECTISTSDLPLQRKDRRLQISQDLGDFSKWLKRSLFDGID